MDELLYHYTSIDRFAQILKNRTIRLSPLDKMDDLQENITKDIKNSINILFKALSITKLSNEEISLEIHKSVSLYLKNTGLNFLVKYLSIFS